MAESRLKVGDMAPDFELMSDSGERVKLSDFRGRRVILYFYPQDDTPGCTTQACGFRDHYPQIQERDAVVLGISPDDVASHRKFKTKYNLPFTLLVDEAHKVAEAYGVWGLKPSTEAQYRASARFFGKTYYGVIRSHFVIDEAGRLADVQVRVSPDDSVARALEAIGVQPRHHQG